MRRGGTASVISGRRVRFRAETRRPAKKPMQLHPLRPGAVTPYAHRDGAFGHRRQKNFGPAPCPGWVPPPNSALAILGSLAMQALCSRIWRLPAIDLRSPLITGLSLSLLLRADEPWLHALAAAIGIASKFALRHDGKHVWNPAGFAIV